MHIYLNILSYSKTELTLVMPNVLCVLAALCYTTSVWSHGIKRANSDHGHCILIHGSGLLVQ